MSAADDAALHGAAARVSTGGAGIGAATLGAIATCRLAASSAAQLPGDLSKRQMLDEALTLASLELRLHLTLPVDAAIRWSHSRYPE